MKILKKIMFLTIAVLALGLSSSCSSDDSGSSNETESGDDYIKFKYNGTSYTFDTGYQSSSTIDIIGSRGIDDTYKQISLSLPLDATVGSHAVVSNLSEIETAYQAYFTFMPAIDNLHATSGTINVTANNSNKIEGTFSFSGTRDGVTVQITEGKFKVSKAF